MNSREFIKFFLIDLLNIWPPGGNYTINVQIPDFNLARHALNDMIKYPMLSTIAPFEDDAFYGVLNSLQILSNNRNSYENINDTPMSELAPMIYRTWMNLRAIDVFNDEIPNRPQCIEFARNFLIQLGGGHLMQQV